MYRTFYRVGYINVAYLTTLVEEQEWSTEMEKWTAEWDASWRTTTKPAGTDPTSVRVSCAICLQRSAKRHRWDLVGRRPRRRRRPSEALHVTGSDVSYISPPQTTERGRSTADAAVCGTRGAKGGRRGDCRDAIRTTAADWTLLN